MKHSVKEHVTKGGTNILCINIPGIQSCEIAIAIRSGYRFSMQEDPTKYEAPHILEHLVFDGSRSYPSSDDLQDVFSRAGGESNGFTTPYFNMFAFHTRARHLKDTLTAAIDMIYFPSLTERSLDEEREVIRNEHQERMGDFSLNAALLTVQQISPEATFAVHQQLELLDIPNLRDIRDYHKKYYTRKNTQIVVAADFTDLKQTEIVSFIDNLLSDVPAGKKQVFPKLKLETSTGQLHFEPIGKSIQESTLSFSFVDKGDPGPVQRLSLQLFTQLASGMKSYSLNHILRKKGLTYGLDCSPFSSIESHGIDLNLATQDEKLSSVLAHTLEGLLKLSREGVSEAQFEGAKHELTGALEDAADSPASIMGWYLDDYLIAGTLGSPDDDAKLLGTITQQSMLKSARRILNYKNLYGTVFTSKPRRIASVVITINEAVLRDNKPVTQRLLDDSTILLTSVEGRSFRIATFAVLSILGGAFTLPLIDTLVRTQTVAHLAYQSFGWGMFAIGIWWLSLFINNSLQKLAELRKQLLYFGIWCIVGACLLIGFEWSNFAHLTAAAWAHAGIVGACILYLVLPNANTALRALREKATTKT